MIKLSEREKMYVKETSLSQSAKETMCYALKKIRHAENLLKKDIFSFNENELRKYVEDALVGLLPDTVNSYITQYRGYYNWAVDKNFLVETYDYSGVLKEINKNIIENTTITILSRDEVYDFIYNLNDPRDALIVATVFEGIRGEKKQKYREVMLIKNDALVNSAVKLENRKLEVPIDFIDIFNRKSRQLSFYDYDGIKKILYEHGYLIKSGKPGDYGKRHDSNYISTRTQKYIYKGKAINGNILRLSGQLFYLSLIEQIKGELDISNFIAVINRYSSSNTEYKINELLTQYEEYKFNNKYRVIDINKFENVYRQLIFESNIIERKLNIVDKELGDLGERIYLSHLNNKYGKENVFDETKNGVGYDFSLVNSSIKEMHEVKSTKISMKKYFEFHLTIKELKMAYKHMTNYKLAVLFFKNNKIIKSYLVEDPIKNLNLKKQCEKILQLEKEGICVPIDLKISVPVDRLIRYKIKLIISKKCDSSSAENVTIN